MTPATTAPRLVCVNRFFWPDQSATSQMLSDLAFHLAGRGLAVTVLTGRHGYDDPGRRLAPREVVGGVQIERLGAPGTGRGGLPARLGTALAFHLAVGQALPRLLAPGELVLTLTDPPLVGVTVARIARRRGARLVNWVQDVFPEVAAALALPWLAGPAGAPLRAWRDASLRAAALNVALGPAMGAWLAGRGVDPRRIAVIPNWADTAAITPMPAAASQLRRRVCAGVGLVIGYSGNLGRAHDAPTLWQAIRTLAGDPALGWLLIGGGDGMDWLARQARAAGLSRVWRLPYQPRATLADSLGAADLHLVSLQLGLEGLMLPSKLYGVLAAGRPVLYLGDPAGELAGLVRDHRVGLVVRAGDAAGLAAAIRALAADRDARAAMGERARALALARYRMADRLADWERALERLIDGQ